jgi:hypothetical protein
VRFLKRHRTALASGVVLVVGAATLVVFALSADGYAVRHVDLNDGGIWVTSDTDGLFGRLNRPAGALDAAFYPPGGAQSAYQLDVFQDDAAVVAWDRGAGKLFPVDVDRAVAAGEQAVPVSAGDRVGLAGGTLAVLDPSSGKVRATRLDPESPAAAITGIGPGATPVADLGPDSASADVAVGQDGSVYAVSSSGRVAIVRPDGAGFDAPTNGRLTAAVRSVVTTVVGDRLVVLDPSTGTVVLPDGAGASIGASAGAVLQQPGPDADAVLVATTKSLLSVSLSDGRATVLSSAGTGAPAAPVRLGDCVHAAWAGSPGAYVRSCDGGPARPGNLRDLGALVHPEFRVNRDAIVLNDLASGALWDVENRLKVDDWNAVRPPPVRKQNDKSNNENAAQNVRDQPPKAVDDTLGARPGRTTVLHVLDNDSDPSGNILAVASVTAPDNPAATLAIAPDGQSVEIAMPAGSGDVHFKYTVDDGKGLNATASVTVTARGRNDEQTPQPRAGFQPKAWTVAAGGTLSLPVLPDWRDFDGDPVVLASATATVGSVTTTPDGFLDYTAPPNGGQQTVHYTVSDGIGAPVPATVQVIVQPPTAATPVAAVAQPDVAKGEVGQPIEIHPLANDLPGADPTDPNARLALPGAVPAVSGLDVTTDTRTGTVTVTAPTAGTYVLTYSAAFGNAPFARGTIRVDVVAAPTSPQVPVAMPDTAVLHGAAPVTVDVLANDYDPAGLVLAVQHAAPVDAGSQLRVAVVKGHWLRIDAQTPALQPNPEIVRYTVTDGVTSPVTGEVTVTQLPAPANDTPVPQDDYATVRAGDLVSVPVLDNDTDPGGDPITLVRDVPGAPGSGRLTVTSASGTTGTAYVSGSGVMFVAPSTVAGQQTVTVAYVAQDPAGDQAVGHLHVTIDPAASAADPDQPPAPQPIETRAVAGDTVTLSVPTTGVDPDGDSVCVVGVGSAPTLGRITAIGAGSLTYQAYPSSAGTDAFTYLVTDRYGRTGQATIRVAVVPPGDPQPPVAVDDIVTAAPGVHVAVDPLANDLIAPDDTVTVAPLDTTNPGIGTAATLASAGGPVRLTAPGLAGKPFVVRYAETDGIGDPSSADIVMHAQAGYNIPPIAVDTTAHPAPGAHSVDVDVLSGDADPDGDSAALTISHVYAAGAHVNGAKVTLPVLAYPQNVPYEIRDGGGATAVAVIHVPAVGAGAPYLKPGQSITVARNGTTTVSLPTLVADPAGHPLRFTTTDQVWASPSTGLTAREQGETQLVVTARADYAGPAAVAFQVTDGTSLTDPHAHTAVITVPVQVGPSTPVLRCPADPITVIEGGAPVKVDVSSVCHVWVPDPATLATQRYSASWQGSSGGLTLGGAGTHVLSVTAAGSTTPGAVGRLTVGVAGADVTPAQLRFRVTAAAPPSMAPVTVDGVKAGDTASVDVTSYVRSQLRDPAVSVVSATQTGGMPASVSHAGATVRISPNPQAHGTLTFAVVVTDVSDPTRTDRRATGQITMHVLGVPDAPGTPAPGLTVLNRVVSLSWSAPANNGAPIDSYEVDYGGGHQTCAASPCDITGLANGTSYTFTVKAHNLVGWSPPSGGSAPAVPNTVPGAVTGMTTSDPQDGSLHVSWNAPQDDGTPVLHYEVTWTGGGAATVTGTSTTATGLTNDDTYTFTVIAVNAQGLGPSATVVGQSAGAPATPSAPTLAAADSADSSSKAVVVSWSADDPNGPGPTTYTVDRTGGGSGKTVCSAVTATSCDDDGLANDGTVYTYTVTAANSAPGSAHTSPPSAGTAVEASATPDPITGVSAAPTGNDGQATVSFDAPVSHGATSTVSCTANGTGCGSWTFSPNGQRGVTETITGLANGTGETITLTDCNGSKGGAYAGNPCDSGVSTSVTTYGPIKSLTISPSVSGTNVNYAVGVDPNGRPATVHVQTSHGFSQDFTTGTGQWNWSGGDNVGYSTTDTITVTVSDPGRATVSGSNAATTGPPPPPPPTVTVSRGASCGQTCINAGCTSSCQYIHVQTANFGGNVTCTFNSQHGSGGFVSQTYAANQSKDSFNWFGFPGQWVQVTCGGVSSPQTPW